MADLSRHDRKQASERLSQLADEVAAIARWLDTFGDRQQDADRASVLGECASRDLLAMAWLTQPADHSLPNGWLDGSRAMRG